MRVKCRGQIDESAEVAEGPQRGLGEKGIGGVGDPGFFGVLRLRLAMKLRGSAQKDKLRLGMPGLRCGYSYFCQRPDQDSETRMLLPGLRGS